MREVWKFNVFAGDFFLDLPAGAEPLCIQLQDGEPKLWARVDPKAPVERRVFCTVPTGRPLGDQATYVGTFQKLAVSGEPLVFHVFDLGELPF